MQLLGVLGVFVGGVGTGRMFGVFLRYCSGRDQLPVPVQYSQARLSITYNMNNSVSARLCCRYHMEIVSVA